jgi:hypothetical protein
VNIQGKWPLNFGFPCARFGQKFDLNRADGLGTVLNTERILLQRGLGDQTNADYTYRRRSGTQRRFTHVIGAGRRLCDT